MGGGLAGLAAAAYWPALQGPFVFDDLYLPFVDPAFAGAGLRAWVTGARPVLMLSYWLNFQASGTAPLAYHATNLVLHVAVSVLVFFIVLPLLEKSRLQIAAALFAAGLFLLHPVQTEAVAYVAGRSDIVSALFVYAALAVFLFSTPGKLSALRVGCIVALFVCACLAKESAIVLPALILATDGYWGERGASRVRLYVPMSIVLVLGAAYLLLRVLPGAQGVGLLSVNGVTWWQYLLTECRAVWVYIRLFFLPYGQSADYDFRISRTLADAEAFFGLVGLIGLVVIAVLARKRYRVASYGICVFLLMLVPTSSVVPIADPLAERRMYLPFLGLVLVVADVVRRWGARREVVAAALAGVLLVAVLLSYRRNQVWSSAVALWADTVEKSPRKSRPRFQLAYAYAQSGECGRAVDQYATAARMGPRDYRLLLDWGLACDCAGQSEDALARLEEAAKLNRTAHVFSQIGLIYAKQGKSGQALEALGEAERADATFEATYLYRGILYARLREFENAEADFRRALQLNPMDETARRALEYAVQERRAGVQR